jgi:hypothetical protein
MVNEEAVLCYVDDEGDWAYFTTAPLEEQSGDDWNDCPWEHNAGTPIAREPYEVFKIAYDGPFETPNEGYINSPFSVDMINAGAIAWLRSSRYMDWEKETVVCVHAGTPLKEFITLIEKGGGKVYLPK